MLACNITRQQRKIFIGTAAEHDGFEMSQLLLGQLVESAHKEHLFLKDLCLRVYKRYHIECFHIH